MWDYDNDDGLPVPDRHGIYEEEKLRKQRERVKQRKIIRCQDLTAEEIKTRGGALLSKIIAVIPKKMGDRYSVLFADGVQKLKINLALHPNTVVDYVVQAFLVKEWKARHVYSDRKDYDYLELILPEDWLKRVLNIGRYSIHKIKEEKGATITTVIDGVKKTTTLPDTI